MIYKMTLIEGTCEITFEFTDYSKMMMFAQVAMKNYVQTEDYSGRLQDLKLVIEPLPDEEEL